MAAIKENFKGKKITSFRFRTCLGRDENGKQIFKSTTWYPPSGLTNARSRKAAVIAAEKWEQQVKSGFEPEANNSQTTLQESKYTFEQFVNEVWFPLCVQDGSHRPSTVAMYTHILDVILPYFKGMALTEITGVKISQYLRWLRNDYRTKYGKPLAPKSIKHHYNILRIIFNYAEKQDFIEKNPMRKVDAPRVERKNVDALSQEQVIEFLAALDTRELDFKCIMYVLITTGLRRGEACGLQWSDIDFENETISVIRNVTYTPQSGIVVSKPKTRTSIRTIPVMKSTLQLLREQKAQQQKSHPYTEIDSAFVFPSDDSILDRKSVV